MDAIVMVDGRQAIPVRAIPLLTNWRALSPDVIASILASDQDTLNFLPAFEGLRAHYLKPDGTHEPIQPGKWKTFVVQPLQVLSEKIEAEQRSHAAGRDQWRQESLGKLFAGAFVWRDEFESAYLREYGPMGCHARSSVLSGGNKQMYLEALGQIGSLADGSRATFEPDDYVLDYSLAPLPPQWLELVREGFESVAPDRLLANQTSPGSISTVPQATPKYISDVLQEGAERLLQRGAAQEAAILMAIRSAAQDPLSLPTNEPGRPGVKAAVQATLKDSRLFVGKTTFKKAWERLRERGEIADAQR